MNNNEILLSKEDYLASSTEYQNEKEQLRKKYRNIMIVGIVILVFSISVLPVILVPLAFQKEIHMLVVFFACSAVLAVGVTIAGVSSGNMKKKPEDLGNQYYQKYVAEFRAKNQQ